MFLYWRCDKCDKTLEGIDSRGYGEGSTNVHSMDRIITLSCDVEDMHLEFSYILGSFFCL